MNDTRGRVFDTTIPLYWLISAIATVIVVGVGIGVSFTVQGAKIESKVDNLLISITEVKGQIRDQSGKYESLRDRVESVQRTTDLHEVRIGTVERQHAQEARNAPPRR